MKLMLRTTVMISLFMTTIFSANAQKPTTPLELNNYFASMTDSLYKGGTEWGTQLNIVSVSKEYSKLAPFRIKMHDYIESRILELTNMKDIKGSGDLRKAMIEFMNFEGSMILNAFIPLEKFDSTSSADSIKVAIDHLMKMAEKEGEFLSKVNQEQVAYGKLNGFTVE